jgi:hypothetical protein
VAQDPKYVAAYTALDDEFSLAAAMIGRVLLLPMPIPTIVPADGGIQILLNCTLSRISV